MQSNFGQSALIEKARKHLHVRSLLFLVRSSTTIVDDRKIYDLQGMCNLGQEIRERFIGHVSNHGKGNVPREDAIPNLGKILNANLQRLVSIIAYDRGNSKVLR